MSKGNYHAQCPNQASRVSDAGTLFPRLSMSPLSSAPLFQISPSAQDLTADLNAFYAKVDGPKKEPVSDITKSLFVVLSDNGRLNETNSVIQGFNELIAKHGRAAGDGDLSCAAAKDSTPRLEIVLK